MLKLPAIAVVMISGTIAIAASGIEQPWTALPAFPDPHGVAGAFVGESDGAVIVAGGANFPKAPPWRGGKKVCTDAVHVLTRDAGPPESFRWIANAATLAHPSSYGVSIPTERGVLMIGGCDTKRCYADVRRARWSRDDGHVEFETLPPLPRPLAYMTGARAGEIVFIAGGQETLDNPPRATTRFYTLDLSREGQPDSRWREQTSWPGPARIVAVSAAMTERAGPAFYLFSGRNAQPGAPPQPLTDAYRFDAASGRWETLPPIQPPDATAPRCVMAGAAIAQPAQNRILLLGGDPGGLFTTIENLRRDIASSAELPRKQILQRELEQTLDRHPGFPGDVLCFDVASRRYTRATLSLPSPPPVTTTPCIAWGSRLLLVSGEIRPGLRTPNVWLQSWRDAAQPRGR